MNRDQAKSKAFSEKKRGEVEDGTTGSTRQDKAREKGLELEKLIGFRSINFPAMEVGPLLDIIARERGHVPVSDKFLARLFQEVSPEDPNRGKGKARSTTTADWLKQFIESPYTTSPDHPALKKCSSSAREEDSDQAFQVYIRTYETTVQRERTLLKGFLHQYPQYTVSVNAKLRSLAETPDQTIWGHYIGQTIDTDPLGRYEDDLGSAPDSMMKKWLSFSSYEWVIWEFRAFHTPLGEIFGAASDIWRSRSDFHEIEYGLVLAADKRGWNSAPGGLPQASYTTPPDLSSLLGCLSPSPTQPKNKIGNLRSESLSLQSYPDEIGTLQSPARIRQHFRDNYSMGPAVLNRMVNQACSFGYTDGTSRFLLVGSRITRRDGQGDSDWWNNSGPACVLWRLSYDAVTKTASSGIKLPNWKDEPYASTSQIVANWEYDQRSLATYGGFVDLWPVPLHADPSVADYSKACGRLRQLIGEIIRPRVVCFMSREVCSLMDAGAFTGGEIGEGYSISQQIADLEAGFGMIESSGSIRVRKIGEHYCVAVTQVHPGFFAYDPSFQPALYPLFICCSAIVRLAKTYADQCSSWGADEAQSVIDRVNDQLTQGLARYIDSLKRQISSIFSIKRSITQLLRPMTVEEFDQRSVNSQSVRKSFVEADVTAIGDPWSVERMEQVKEEQLRLEQLGILDLSSDDLCSVPKGKHMRISVYSKKGKIGSIASAAAIEKARAAIDMVRRDEKRRVDASTTWPGYSGNNPTLKEAVHWISEPPSSNAIKRTSAKDSESLIFCKCWACDAIGLVRMNFRLHFCSAPSEGASTGPGTLSKGISLVAAGSTVEFYKLVIPVALYYDEVQSEIDQILTEDPAFRVRRDETDNIISIVKTGSRTESETANWEQFQVKMWEKLGVFKRDGMDWMKAMRCLDVEFQSYIRELGDTE